MRINSISQISQIYQSSMIKKTSTTKKSETKDEFQISAMGIDYNIAKKAVSNASDIRQEKVDELKSKINSGQYEVSAENFAEKLLSAYKNKN